MRGFWQAANQAGEDRVAVAAISILCQDGYTLHGHHWAPDDGRHEGTVIVNPATGVLARYYHFYARFLVENGLRAITYDYRGIGASRPAELRGSGILWRHWGERDFEAVVRWARQSDPSGPLLVVGHSIGGFLPGFAASAPEVDRMLTVGAQYAYFRDYAPAQRARLILKWHLAMPAVTLAFGYFPGRRFGWLEDLPFGVANEWSFRSAAMERSYPRRERGALLDRFVAVRAPILAVGMSDDELGTEPAIQRALSYYRGSDRVQVLLRPADLAVERVGHFGLFHSRHKDSFWPATLTWLRGGPNPWPERVVERRPAAKAVLRTNVV